MKDLKQRSASNNNGNSGLDSAVSTEVESHLKLDTRDGVTAFENVNVLFNFYAVLSSNK